MARRERLLKQLGAALDAQDPYLDGHSRRVARYTATVARRMGLPDEQVKRIRAAAAVHDVGKLRVPQELLRKATPLSDEEFEAVMRHPEEGAEMVSCLGDDELTEIVRHHHERFDGLGYPAGLRGVEIPLGARIVAVADTFDAITSARPYRQAARHKQAIDVLIANAGTQLDPDVVRVFLRCYAGRKASVMWVILAVSPQRAFAWMRHGGSAGEPTPVLPVGELAAGTIGRAVVVAAAVGTSVGVGVARDQNQILRRSAGVPVASAAPFSLPLNPRAAAAHPAPSSAGQVFGQAGLPGTAGPPMALALTKGIRALASGAGLRLGNSSSTGGGSTLSLLGGAPPNRPDVAGRRPRERCLAGCRQVAGRIARPSSDARGRREPSVFPRRGHRARLDAFRLRRCAGGQRARILWPGKRSLERRRYPGHRSASASPAPPGPAGGGGNPGGGTTGGGGGVGGPVRPKHGGPGAGGWGPGGHPHNGPGDGGWGPGGNPGSGSARHSGESAPLTVIVRLPLAVGPRGGEPHGGHGRH